MLFERDPLGNDPFYYTVENSEFIYDGSLSGLIEKIGRKLHPNIDAMKDFLWHEAIAPQETMYNGIYRLPPGYRIEVDGLEWKVERYWMPERIQTDYDISFDEAIEKFRTLFTKAVLKLLPSDDTPVACELSGGFDSSSVLCTLSHYTHREFVALTMDFDEGDCDERRYADAVLQKCPVPSIRHECQSLDYAGKYDMQYNYALSPHWPLWSTFTMYAPMIDTMQSRSIRTIFTGQLGDQLLWGYTDSLFNYLSRGKFLRFYQEWRDLPHRWQWLWIQSRIKLAKNLSETSKKRIKRLLGRNNKKENEHIPPLSFEEKKFDSMGMDSAQKRTIDTLTNAHYMLYADSSIYRAIEEKYGVRYVHPYADRELVEFMLSLPTEFRYSQGKRRFFHAEAMKDLLPREVLDRSDKAEFSAVLDDQMAALDRKSLWEDPSIVKLGIVDKKTIEKYEEIFLRGELSGHDRHRYWCMINLEYWYNLNPNFH